jgi:magnesium transporter
VLDIISLPEVFEQKERFALYIRSDLCLIVSISDENGRISGLFHELVQRYETGNGMMSSYPEKFLYNYLEALITNDRKFLENMEFNMSLLETRIMKERIDESFINEILLIRKELMLLWNYYEQLVDLGEALKENEDQRFPVKHARSFGVFTGQVQRLSENVTHLKEYTVQLRETHDAMMDYHLNHVMKLFTVITAIFSPLSLIAGWYGMNFQYMPELRWRYGYLAVVLLSVLVVIGSVVVFKKYKLLQK